MTITTTEKIATIINELSVSLAVINDKYKKDTGTCGMAMVQLFFGRKTKVRKELSALCVTNDYASSYYGQTCYGLTSEFKKLLPPKTGVQNMSYHEEYAKKIAETFEAHFQLEAHVNSWMD